jgi:hypothetical protein
MPLPSDFYVASPEHAARYDTDRTVPEADRAATLQQKEQPK